MLIRRRRAWELPGLRETPEALWLDRRRWLLGAAGLGLVAGGLAGDGFAQDADPLAGRFPAPRNPAYTLDRALTPEEVNANHNNFYEFGSSKRVASAARALRTRPWTLRIDGMVEQEQTLAIDDLFRQVDFEERLYRLRCVEAWAMTIPWTGFPMRRLVEIAKPLASARYVQFQTFLDPRVAPGQRQSWYPWPYTEGLTIAEATHELAFMVTGAYGKTLVNQHGAPLRFVTPWKYGFKQSKSIVRVTFTDQRPKGFWEALQPREYGFWANVNPAVDHPRWSQATETMIGTGERLPTQLFNGYAESVAHLYRGLEHERLWA